jgi:hypothetical protein
MDTIFGSVAASSFRGSTNKGNINKPWKLTRTIVLMALLIGIGAMVVGTSVEAQAQITVAQLAGPWQIALVGDTFDCGTTPVLINTNLNSSGTGPAIVTGGCELSGNQVFEITSLNSHGTGTAMISCTAPCEFGPSFNIQVDGNKQLFELNAQDGNSTFLLAGTAVKQVEEAMTIAQLAGPWQISLAGNTGCGASSLDFTGSLNTSGVAAGALTGSSTGCTSSTSPQTLTITSLGMNGSGTANLSCGSGCGWDFEIQVSPDRQRFNLVDTTNFANGLAGTAVSQAAPAITIPQLVGSWQISLVGNTGCGQSAMGFTGLLNTSGSATGTMTGMSTGCTSSTSTQTFTINSLKSDGTGTASLSCGVGCGWNFNIQVSPNKKMFNLVDTGSGDPNFNELTGTAVAQGFTIVPDLTSSGGDSLQEAQAAVSAVGLRLKSSGIGVVVSQAPKAGTSVPLGSTVTVLLNNN